MVCGNNFGKLNISKFKYVTKILSVKNAFLKYCTKCGVSKFLNKIKKYFNRKLAEVVAITALTCTRYPCITELMVRAKMANIPLKNKPITLASFSSIQSKTP